MGRRDELSIAPEVPTGDRMSPQPKNLGELKRSPWSEEKIAGRTIRQELRENLLHKMEKGEPLFPGVHGYDDTVIPQIINAILSRHHFILLGLRGQAKSRIMRGPGGISSTRRYRVIAGLRDSTTTRTGLCAAPAANELPRRVTPRRSAGFRAKRYVEKLATPDVTIADMIGDVDPIKAARAGQKSFRRTDDSLRLAAAREPRNFRHQRTAGPGGKNSGGPLQYHAGRRRAD